MNSISDYDLGWLVGILEGEGCFYLDQRWAKGTGSVRIQVKMTDEDTVNKVASLFEQILGKPVEVRESSANLAKQSQPYQVSIGGQDARALMKLVVKRMSWRRRQRIWQCLNNYKQPKTTMKLTLSDLKLVSNA